MLSSEENFIIKKKHLFWLFFIGLFSFIFYRIQSVLFPFVFSFVIVIFFSGIVNRLEKVKIPRALSSGIVTICVFGFLIYLFCYAGRFAFSKASNVSYHLGVVTDISKNISYYISEFFKKYDVNNNFNMIAGKFANEIANYIENALKGIAKNGYSFISNFVLLALTPIITFMMLKDMPSIKRKFFSLLPESIRKDAKSLIYEMYNSVFNFIEGQTIAAVVLSIMYAIMLLPIGVNNFILLGIIIGFSSFIPYIGFYSAVIITIFSVQNQFHDIYISIITCCILILGQVIDSGFITPKIVGDKLKVHPLWVIFGVLVSVPLFGVLGILISLPLVGICGVIIRFVVKKYKNSSYYKTTESNFIEKSI